MGKAFFTGWELWQKMTFVLACGIVATIVIGLCKLRYDQYRIAKYSKVEKGKQVATPTPEMLEANHDEIKEDIPFGIRAIESGIEVDGVWISRSNTPVTSSRSSIIDFKLPHSHTSSQLDLPHALAPSNRTSPQPPSSFDMATGAERVPAVYDSRSSSPGRGRPPVSMTTRYSYNMSRTLQALEGGASGRSSARREPVSDKQSSGSSRDNSGRSSRRTSDESDYPETQPPYEAAYLNPRQPAVYMPIDPRTDLELLQSHRMSHVAETGQLTPRARVRPGNNSGDWASAVDSIKYSSEYSTLNGVDYFVPQQKTPSPPPPPAAAPRSETPPAMENPATSQAKQAIPLLESYAPRPFYLPDVYQPKGPQHQFSYDDMPIEVQTSQNQQRDSQGQVLRKVNSGFEILRPGTLLGPEEEKPLSSQEKRHSNRLQKKRRTSSSASRQSHFVEAI